MFQSAACTSPENQTAPGFPRSLPRLTQKDKSTAKSFGLALQGSVSILFDFIKFLRNLVTSSEQKKMPYPGGAGAVFDSCLTTMLCVLEASLPWLEMEPGHLAQVDTGGKTEAWWRGAHLQRKDTRNN